MQQKAPRLSARRGLIRTGVLWVPILLTLAGCPAEDSTTNSWTPPGGTLVSDAEEYSETASDPNGGISLESIFFDREDDPNSLPSTLLVSATGLEFGETRSELPFYLGNGGDDWLAYDISTDVEWATILPSSGKVGSAPITIWVRIDRAALGEGSQTGHITVTAGDESAIITMHVGPPGDTPEDKQQTTESLATNLRIVPWIENGCGCYNESVAEGLTTWQEVADAAVVEILASKADAYLELQEMVPGITIIPALKSSKYFDLPDGTLQPFDTVAPWVELANDIAMVTELTGQSRVLLDHEVAIKAYWRNHAYDIDAAQLREGLSYLPDDIEVIWYPGLVGETEGQRERSLLLCQLAESEVDYCTFVDLGVGGPLAVDNVWSVAGREILSELASDSVSPLLYFYGPDSPWWQDDQVLEALGHVERLYGSDREVIIYTGTAHWRSAAEAFVAQLLPDH